MEDHIEQEMEEKIKAVKKELEEEEGQTIWSKPYIFVMDLLTPMLDENDYYLPAVSGNVDGGFDLVWSTVIFLILDNEGLFVREFPKPGIQYQWYQAKDVLRIIDTALKEHKFKFEL